MQAAPLQKDLEALSLDVGVLSSMILPGQRLLLETPPQGLTVEAGKGQGPRRGLHGCMEDTKSGKDETGLLLNVEMLASVLRLGLKRLNESSSHLAARSIART